MFVLYVQKPLINKQIKYCSLKCKNKYQPNTYYKYQKARGISRKQLLIDQKGGKCNHCGYNRCLSALEFHHIDPKQKEFSLDSRQLTGKSWKKILVEVEKCLLLCSNCHRELHSTS